jgi:L-aminopeptidase/D-esterase-like protein
MAAAGARNLITAVPGILVGQAEDPADYTGTTVVLAERPAVAAVDVGGGAPGTRETELLGCDALVDRIDAVVLSGGSAFGLDAAAGVMDWLGSEGRGFAVGSPRVPIVPAAILFDLAFAGRSWWPSAPPYCALGRRAATAAAADFALGNAGAGRGARAGRLKGSGSASSCLAGGAALGAIVAVNSWGSAVRPDCGRFWAAETESATASAPGRPRVGWLDRPIRAMRTLPFSFSFAKDAATDDACPIRTAVMPANRLPTHVKIYQGSRAPAPVIPISDCIRSRGWS